MDFRSKYFGLNYHVFISNVISISRNFRTQWIFDPKISVQNITFFDHNGFLIQMINEPTGISIPTEFSIKRVRFEISRFIRNFFLISGCWGGAPFKTHILKYHFPRKINVFEHFRVKKYIFDLKNLKVFIIYVEHARVAICSTYKY